MSDPFHPTSYGPQPRSGASPNWEPGSALAVFGEPSLPVSIAELPDVYGLIFGDGYQRMWEVVRNTALPVGLIPPKEVVVNVGEGEPDTTSPVIPGGVVQPVLVWDPKGEGIRTATTQFLLLKGGGVFSYNVFAIETDPWVGGTPAQNYAWQVKRQTTTEGTLRLMADAINGVSSPEIVLPDTTDPAYYSDGMDEVSAEVKDGKLYITWLGHPRMGWPFPGPPSQEPTNYDLLEIQSSLLESEGVSAYYPPVVYGRSDPNSSEISQAYQELWLDSSGTWSNTGVVTVADTDDLAVARAYFIVRCVPTFETADHTYQVQVGSTPSRINLLLAIENITHAADPLSVGDPNVREPNPSDPNYTPQLGIGDIRFRARGRVGGLFYRETPGSAGNAAWVYQSVQAGGDPHPPNASWLQFVGGGDGYDPASGPEDVPGAGDYGYGWSWYREVDKARSGLGYRYQLRDHGGGPIGIVGWPTPEDPDVDFHRLWRTLIDGLGDYFKVDDILIQTPTQPAYTDDKGDFEIAGAFGSLLYNPRDYRTRAAGYPENHRHLARHQGAIWGGGLSRSAPQTGTCTWTQGSDVVVIDSPVVPTRLWVGRYIRHPDYTKRYVIIKVNEANGQVTIGEDFEEEGGDTLPFVCEDERAAYSTYRAVTNFHNQWPARPLEGTDGRHKDGITGLLARQQAIYAWTRSATWVVTGSASGGYAIEPISESVGLVNQRCLVIHEGVAYYLAGPAGVYRWDFAGVPVRISNPPFANVGDPRGIQGTIDRINWDAAEWFHGVLDPDNRLIRWFVAVDGSEYPNFVITLDLKSQTWGEDDAPPVTSSCAVLLPSGGWIVLAGDAEGRIWALDRGDSDGAQDAEPNQTVLTADDQSVQLTAAIMEKLDGCGVLIVDPVGKRYQRAWVSEHASDTLYFREQLEWTPAAGNTVVLGAIDMRIRPNRFDAGVKDEEKMVPVTWISSRIESQGEYYLWVYDDEAGGYVEPRFDSAVGDLAHPDGVERFRTNMRGHELGFEIRAFEPGYRPAFRRFELQMVVRSKPTTGT